jgi:uncharacterized coiled-coil protein SlyX
MPTSDGQDYSQLSEEMYRVWERSMTDWWDQVLESNSLLKGLGENLSAQNTARAQYERSVDESLTRMHLPTRTDLTQLAKIAILLEERLLTQEDTLAELRDRMAQLEKETLQARIEAAEARIEARESRAALQEHLDALQEKLAAPTKTTRSRKKTETP